jgi:hypothetical protein
MFYLVTEALRGFFYLINVIEIDAFRFLNVTFVLSIR